MIREKETDAMPTLMTTLCLLFSLLIFDSCAGDQRSQVGKRSRVTAQVPAPRITNSDTNDTDTNTIVEDGNDKVGTPAVPKVDIFSYDYPRLGGTDVSNIGSALTASSPKSSPKMSPKSSPKSSPKITASLVNNPIPTPDFEFPDYIQLPLHVSLDHLDRIPFELVPEGVSCIGSLKDNSIYAQGLWATCAISALLRTNTYGENGGDYDYDGIADCNDLKVDTKEIGLFPGLFCSPDINNFDNLKQIGFPPQPNDTLVNQTVQLRYRVINFENQNKTNPTIGYWDRDDANSFPLNLALWTTRGNLSSPLSEVKPTLMVESITPFKGTVWQKYLRGNEDFKIRVFTDTINTPEACRKDVSRENCNYQDFFVESGDGNVQLDVGDFIFDIPNKLHYTVISDFTEAPSLIIIEGMFEWDARNSNAIFTTYSVAGTAPRQLDNIRTSYFRIIQKEDELWRSAAFFDADGNSVHMVVAVNSEGEYLSPHLFTTESPGITFINLAENYGAGECKKVGSENTTTESCTKIVNVEDTYGHLFVGQKDFLVTDPDRPVDAPFDLSVQPTTIDAITTEGTFPHEPWGQAPIQ